MGLKESASNTIGVKIMGDLEKQPFVAATKRINNSRKYRKRAADNMAAQWKDTVQEVIDEDDEKLDDLKTEFGDEVFEAVKTALAELNEYNPSGRYPVLELWNFMENRKATLAEGVSHLLNHMKPNKRRSVRPTSAWKPT
ncbi:factor of DNA methylation 2-like [Rosa rugosa]|uniref:factor of DNA methylation 2-like n=1 Tax=Rosa rugosa TaxID=74645 RepID=UPI002B411C17|nr:factor of DNA methylation 2-like [Rosa rugosa]